MEPLTSRFISPKIKRYMTQGKEYITKEKKAELEKELIDLEGPQRKEIIEAIEFAKSLGDLSENAEYHQAREAQGKLEERISEIKRILKEAEVVSSTNKKGEEVEIGSVVEIKKLSDNSKKTFTITGEGEADMAAGKISYQSPLGSALVNKKKGDKVEIVSPSGTIEYKILNVN